MRLYDFTPCARSQFKYKIKMMFKAFLVLKIFLCFTRLTSVTAEDDDYTLKEVKIESKNGQPVKKFTSEEIQQYDGSDVNKPLYMGIKGVVFDVTKGKDFYGKSGPYNVLIGKDSTRAVAKMSLEKEDLTHDLTGLSGSTLKFLDEIVDGTYLPKYPIVGYMDYLLEQIPEQFENVSKQEKLEL